MRRIGRHGHRAVSVALHLPLQGPLATCYNATLLHGKSWTLGSSDGNGWLSLVESDNESMPHVTVNESPMSDIVSLTEINSVIMNVTQ
jgi:hypothetical protein